MPRINMEKTQKELASIGIAVKDASGELRPYQQIIEETARKFDSLSKAEQTVVTEALAGKMHITRMASLLSNYAIAVNAADVSSSAFGSSLEENSRHMESLQSKLNQVVGSSQELSNAIGQSGLEAAMKGTLTGTTTFIKGMTELIDSGVGGKVAVAALTASITAFTIGLATKLPLLSTFVTGIVGATRATAAFTASLLANPLTATLVALTAITTGVIFYSGALKEAREEYEKFTDVARKSNDKIKEIEDSLKKSGSTTKQQVDDYEKMSSMLVDVKEKLEALRDAQFKQKSEMYKSQFGEEIPVTANQISIDLDTSEETKNLKEHAAAVGINILEYKTWGEVIQALDEKHQKMNSTVEALKNNDLKTKFGNEAEKADMLSKVMDDLNHNRKIGYKEAQELIEKEEGLSKAMYVQDGAIKFHTDLVQELIDKRKKAAKETVENARIELEAQKKALFSKLELYKIEAKTIADLARAKKQLENQEYEDNRTAAKQPWKSFSAAYNSSIRQQIQKEIDGVIDVSKQIEDYEKLAKSVGNIGDALDQVGDKEKKRKKASDEAEKAAREREKAEREAIKAAEEARKREIEQLKETEAHYQKMYELKKRLHDLSMETEEYAYSKMKKDSQEARDQLQKMINLRKEGMVSDATEVKRLEDSAVSFEKAAKNEAIIAAQNKYGLSPTDTSNTFSGPHASLVNKYAIANGVNPILSGAVMMQESGGKGNNVMQVNGMNGASVEATIKKGNEILGKLLDKTNGNIEKALAAYNMGEGILKFFDENGGYSRENMKKFSDMQKKKYGYKIYGDPDYIQHVFNRLPDTAKSTTKPTTTVNKGVNTSGDASDFVKLKSDYVKGPTNINPYLLSLLETLAKDKGKTISLTSGGRTKAQQEDLKRRKPGLAAQAGYSKHEYGLAVDVADVWLKNMSESELAKYGLHKPALKSKGEDWHIEPIQTKGVRNPADIKKLSITLATGGGTSVTEVPIDFSKELQGQADDNHSKALELKSRQISEQQLIDEAEQRKVESWLLYYDNEISKIEQRIKDSEIKMKTLDPTSPGYRKELQNQVQLRKDKQDLFHQSAEYIRSVEAKAKKNKDLYSGDFLEEIKKIKEQRGQAWKEVFGEINSISYEIVRNELAELSEKTDQYDRQLNISRTTIGLFREDSAEYRQELEKQADILNQKINIEKETQRIIEERLRTEGLLAHQIEELNKQKDESIRREREYQVEIKRTRQTLYDQVADNLGKIKEARIKQLEKQRDGEIDRIQKQIDSQNESYERRIELKQKELNQLDEQYDKEERLKRLRDIDDEIAKVKADKRFSYITAEGKEILTYNKERVSELEQQRNELLQQYQREDVRKARQQEIEDLRKEKEEKEKTLREQLENVKRNYDQQIETEKQKWDQIIEAAKNGTLGYDDIMNGENGFFPTAIADLQKFGVDVQAQIDQIKAAFESLNNIKVSLPSLGGFGGVVGGGGGGSAYDSNGKLLTPGKSGLDNTRIGSDGMTDYVRDAYDKAIKGGGKVLTRHSGGFVDGKQPSRLAELANKLFNTKPSEQMVKALKGELFVPEHNILNNFIPNMQNLVNSISSPVTQSIPISGDTYQVTIERVVTNNPMEFLKNLPNYVRTKYK